MPPRVGGGRGDSSSSSSRQQQQQQQQQQQLLLLQCRGFFARSLPRRTQELLFVLHSSRALSNLALSCVNCSGVCVHPVPGVPQCRDGEWVETSGSGRGSIVLRHGRATPRPEVADSRSVPASYEDRWLVVTFWF